MPGPGHARADVVVRDDDDAARRAHAGWPASIHSSSSRRGRSSRRARAISGASRASCTNAAAIARGCFGRRSSSPATTRASAGRGQALEREAHQVVVRRRAASRAHVRRRHAADAVAQPRLGHVDARPAARPRAPAEVEVLPLHEERLVEAAELEQRARAGPASPRRARSRSARRSSAGASSSRWRPGMYSRHSRPRASRVRAWMTRPSSQPSCVGSAAKRLASASSASARCARQSGSYATSLFEQQDVVGTRRRARRGCRGSRARGSARAGRVAPSSSATSTLRSVEAAVDDDDRARRRASAPRTLSRQSRRSRSPWWLPTTTAIVSRHRAPRAPRAARRASAPGRARGRRTRDLAGASRGAYRGRRAAPRRGRRAPPDRSPSSTSPPPDARTSSSGPPDGVTSAGTPAASASATTMPKPSCSDGSTNSAALRSGSRDRRRPRRSPRPRAATGLRRQVRPTSVSRASRHPRRAAARTRRAAVPTFLRGSSARPTKTSSGASRPRFPLVVGSGEKRSRVDRYGDDPDPLLGDAARAAASERRDAGEIAQQHARSTQRRALERGAGAAAPAACATPKAGRRRARRAAHSSSSVVPTQQPYGRRDEHRARSRTTRRGAHTKHVFARRSAVGDARRGEPELVRLQVEAAAAPANGTLERVKTGSSSVAGEAAVAEEVQLAARVPAPRRRARAPPSARARRRRTPGPARRSRGHACRSRASARR